MNTVLIYLIFVSVIAIVVIRFNKDYYSGIYISLFFLILLPETIGIKLSSSFPVLTISRTIILVVFYFWVNHKPKRPLKHLRYRNAILVLILTNTVTLLISSHFTVSLKSYLSLLLEHFLFYGILASSIYEREKISKSLVFIYSSIFLVAIIGIIERFTSFQLLKILPSYYYREYENVVYSSFPHPILLGIALAIGLMMTIYFLTSLHAPWSNKTYYIALFIIGSCLYFTFSRGPWLAAILGSLCFYFWGSRKVRKYTISMAIIALFFIIMNSGVYDTIYSLYSTTFDIDSLEGGSYYYRWELWRKAYNEISVDSIRALFGYGLEYHRYQDLSGGLSLSFRSSSFRSWDNDYATILLETGFVGLITYIVFYVSIFYTSLKCSFQFKRKNDNFPALCLSVITIVLFMMSNVNIFTQQIYYIFFAFVAFNTNYYDAV